ncbi:MAG: hypothetical protein JST42_07105 [Bacteroidetes bacterium]|nr:hypothetical protein [Bacteroidota bacterium]
MKELTDHYYARIFAAISRLTRLADGQALDSLTRSVITELWEKKTAFDLDPRKGVFIYKTLLHHVFAHLKNKGDEKRLEYLRANLPINPEFYLS